MKLTNPLTFIIATLLSIGLIAAIWFGFSNGQVEKYKSVSAQRDASLQKIDYYQQKIDEIKKSGFDYLGSLYEQSEKVDQLLPKKNTGASIAMVYDKIAKSMGLDVKDFSPMDKTTSPAGTQTFSGSFTGSYSAIEQWLGALESADNLITVSNLKLTLDTEKKQGESGSAPSTADAGNFNVTMQITFHTSDLPTLAQPSGTQTSSGATQNTSPSPSSNSASPNPGPSSLTNP